MRVSVRRRRADVGTAVAGLLLLAAACGTSPVAAPPREGTTGPPTPTTSAPASPSDPASPAEPSTPAASASGPPPTTTPATTPPAPPAPPRVSASPTGPTRPLPSTTKAPAPPAPSASGAASSCAIPTAFAGQDLERLSGSSRRVALTFDGGANADGADPILRVLAERRVPATFFLTGGFVQDFPEVARQIGRTHVVGNHTMTHPDLTRLSDRQVRLELTRAQDVIRSATGQDPRRFFRFPFGARDARVLGLVNGRCYVAFRWTVDTLGWKGTSGGSTADTVVDRVLDAAVPGAIVLMHLGSHPQDGSTLDADALPTVIRRLRGAGYELVSLSSVMTASP